MTNGGRGSVGARASTSCSVRRKTPTVQSKVSPPVPEPAGLKSPLKEQAERGGVDKWTGARGEGNADNLQLLAAQGGGAAAGSGAAAVALRATLEGVLKEVKDEPETKRKAHAPSAREGERATRRRATGPAAEEPAAEEPAADAKGRRAAKQIAEGDAETAAWRSLAADPAANVVKKEGIKREPGAGGAAAAAAPKRAHNLDYYKNTTGNADARFGADLNKLMAAIDQNERKFSIKPIGPVGKYISMKDERWSDAVECAIGIGPLLTLLVQTYQDEQLCLQLVQQLRLNPRAVNFYRIKIDGGSYRDTGQLKMARFPARDKGYVSVLDVIDVTNTAVENFLYDRQMYSVLLFPGREACVKVAKSNECNVASCYDLGGTRYFATGNSQQQIPYRRDQRWPNLMVSDNRASDRPSMSEGGRGCGSGAGNQRQRKRKSLEQTGPPPRLRRKPEDGGDLPDWVHEQAEAARRQLSESDRCEDSSYGMEAPADTTKTPGSTSQSVEEVSEPQDTEGPLAAGLEEEQRVASSVERPPTTNPIAVKVRDHEGEDVLFTIKRDSSLRKLMRKYAEHAGVNVSALRFFFEGNSIVDIHTPNELEMEDGDVIDASIKAVSTHTGSTSSILCEAGTQEQEGEQAQESSNLEYEYEDDGIDGVEADEVDTRSLIIADPRRKRAAAKVEQPKPETAGRNRFRRRNDRRNQTEARMRKVREHEARILAAGGKQWLKCVHTTVLREGSDPSSAIKLRQANNTLQLKCGETVIAQEVVAIEHTTVYGLMRTTRVLCVKVCQKSLPAIKEKGTGWASVVVSEGGTLLLEQTADRALPPLASAAPCVICFDVPSEGESLQCGGSSGHTICRECLSKHWVQACAKGGAYETERTDPKSGVVSAKGEVPCPCFAVEHLGGCAAGALPEPTATGSVRHLFTAECVKIFDATAARLATSALGSDAVMECPECKDQVYVLDDSGNRLQMGSCCQCSTLLCVACNCRMHTGQTCDEYRASQVAQATAQSQLQAARQLVEAALLRGQFVPCPECREPKRKDDACVHMTCDDCGCHFCYVCGQDRYPGVRGKGSDYTEANRKDCGCDSDSSYLDKTKRRLNAQRLPDETRGDAALAEFHRRRMARFVRVAQRKVPADVWCRLRDRHSDLLTNVIAGRSIDWDEISSAKHVQTGNGRARAWLGAEEQEFEQAEQAAIQVLAQGKGDERV